MLFGSNMVILSVGLVTIAEVGSVVTQVNNSSKVVGTARTVENAKVQRTPLEAMCPTMEQR